MTRLTPTEDAVMRSHAAAFCSEQRPTRAPRRLLLKCAVLFAPAPCSCQGRSKREPVWRSKSSPVEGYGTSGRMASGA